KRLYRDERLAQTRCWLRHLPQFNRRLAVGCIDQREHLRLSVPQGTYRLNTTYVVCCGNGVGRKPLEFYVVAIIPSRLVCACSICTVFALKSRVAPPRRWWGALT